MAKRIFDIFFSLFVGALLLWLMLCIYIAVKFTDRGPAIYWSCRVGKKGSTFMMPKFRTMRNGTPVVATHLLIDSSHHLTKIGSFLRRSSLDELPQLWSIFIGDMSFVGPRPALFNQADLIALRKQYGIDELMPGLTGWAQVNGRDELSVIAKVQYDLEYLQRRSFGFDMKILLNTIFKAARQVGISH
jgi:O-antigen biosynthesis protein WbqP